MRLTPNPAQFKFPVKRIFRFFSRNLPATLLFLFSLFIALRNYDPGTFLTGWDTLHPEFNFGIYWGRILEGLWQEHQGLGAVATQAHASEIPRVIILQFLSLFMTVSQLRYALAFIMLISGPLGVFYFIKKVFLKHFPKTQSELGAFAGGLLYLLNLGTLQHFYVPLEMFLVHYGLLGWVFLSAVRYFETGSRRHITAFLVFSFLIAPQAHTPTLFYAYFMNFGGFFAVLMFTDLAGDTVRRFWKGNHPKRFPITFQRFFLLISFTLLVNAFWLLPNIYFIVRHSDSIKLSKIHHLFSEEAFLQNKEFGRLEDIAIMRNFLFNWGEHVGGGEFGDLLDEWKRHLSRPYVLPIGYGIFATVCFGILVSSLTRQRYALSVFAVFAISLFFLFNVNPPFGHIFVFLQDKFPIFKEAFRFPFTKFSITAIFSYAVFFGYFIAWLGSIPAKIFKSRAVLGTVYLYMYSLLFFPLSYYMLPAIDGELISPSMRVNIPQRYFNMFRYLDSQNAYGRVANLPIHSFWGWVYHDWDTVTGMGYQGAGFLWFGIKQPLMDREFDRWNIINEQYYREMSIAVYSQNLPMLENVLDKFKIRWILYDESIVSPGSAPRMLFYREIKELLASSENIKLMQDFGEGLKIYEYTPKQDFKLTEITESFVYSNDSIFKEYTDPVYATYGTYVADGEKHYPYLGITNYEENILTKYVSSDSENTYFTNRMAFAQLNSEKINDLVQYYISAGRSPESENSYVLRMTDVPGFITNKAFEIPFEVSEPGPVVIMLNSNLFKVDLNSLVVSGSGIYEKLGFASIDPAESLNFKILKEKEMPQRLVDLFSMMESCSDMGAEASYSIEKIAGGFRLSSRDLDACLTLNLNELIDSTTILNDLIEFRVETKEVGARAGLCILNIKTGLCVNKPLSGERGGAFAFVPPEDIGSPYFVRFMAEGLQNTNLGSVEYTNLKINTFSTLFEKNLDLAVLGNVEGEFFGRLTFKKDLDYSGNVTGLRYSPRFCKSGSREFDDSRAAVVSDSYIRYESRGDSLCDSFQFPFASHNTGYILELKARNLDGIPLRICLTNEYSKRCDLYVTLGEYKDFTTHYFLVPPMGKGSGYTVNISNIVFGTGTSVNDLEYISLTPFPYNFLRSVHDEVKKSENESLLIYYQAYEKGWTAFCGGKVCKARHVMVNNWANGWIFDYTVVPSKVRIVFVPQILEYIGFALLVFSFVSVRRFAKDDNDHR